MLPHFLQKRSEPAPFLFGSDGLRAWTGGACAYVYDVRSFLQHLPYPVESLVHVHLSGRSEAAG